MEAQSFAYWLKGYVELNGSTPTETQWKIIVDHLEKVFDKQTPNRDNGIQQPTQGPNTSTPYPMPVIGPGKHPITDWKYPGIRTMELRPSDMPGITPAIIC